MGDPGPHLEEAATCADADLVEVICTAVADDLNVNRGHVLDAVRAIQEGATTANAVKWLRKRAY